MTRPDAGDRRGLGLALASACLLGWGQTTIYTNHAPLIPVLMERLRFSPTEAGLLTTAVFLAIAVATVPAGILSDRLGPKPVGSVGLAIAFLSSLSLGYADGFATLLMLKVVGGLGGGAAFIAGVRYVTVTFPPTAVYRAQGLFGGCSQLGGGSPLYLMPALYALFDWQGAFRASSALVALTLGLWIVLAPDRRMPLPASRLSDAVTSREVWLLGLMHITSFGLSMLLGTWITTFLVRDLALDLLTAGTMGSGVLVVGVLARPAGGVLIDQRRVGPKALIRGSVLMSAIGLGLLALPGRPLWVALVGILAMGIALSLPYSAIMITASAALPTSPGAAVGMVGGIGLVGVAGGAPLVGALYTQTGSFSVAFALLGGVCLVVFWVARGLQGDPPPERPGSR